MECLYAPEPLLYYALEQIPQGEPELPARGYAPDIPVCRAARFHAHFQVLAHLLENGATPSRVTGSGSLGYFDLHRVPVAVLALFEKHGIFWKNIEDLPERAFVSVWYSGYSWTEGQRSRDDLMMRKLEWFLERGLGLNDQFEYGNMFTSLVEMGGGSSKSGLPFRFLRQVARMGADVHGVTPTWPEGSAFCKNGACGRNAFHLVLEKSAVFYSGALVKNMAFLYRLGVDANVQDEFSNTPLHYLAQNDRATPGLVRALLRWGAMPSLTVQNKKGKTPLDLAVEHGNPAVAHHLREMDSIRLAGVWETEFAKSKCPSVKKDRL
jgi:hypothetical protein